MPNFVFRQNMNGTNATPAKVKLPVAASQTLVMGDAVVLSSGQLVKASTSFGRCAGIMAEDSTNATAGTLLEVFVTTPSQVWEATASADATNYVLQSRTYDLNSSQVVNVADTTGGSIQILKLGSSTTKVYIQFTANELA